MVELDDGVVDQLVHGGDSLLLRDVVKAIERHHERDRAGVSPETVLAYVEELDAQPNHRMDVEAFERDLDESLTDEETWAGADRLYRVGEGRVSVYPKSWHDRFDGAADVRAVVEFLLREDTGFREDINRTVNEPGIPEETVLEVVTIVGRVSREDAKQRLQDLRREGVLVEDADQHPQASVMLAEEDGEEYRDEDLSGG